MGCNDLVQLISPIFVTLRGHIVSAEVSHLTPLLSTFSIALSPQLTQHNVDVVIQILISLDGFLFK